MSNFIIRPQHKDPKMNILKQAQHSGKNVVMVGATGPGNTTSIETLSVSASRDEGARVVVIAECPEIVCA